MRLQISIDLRQMQLSELLDELASLSASIQGLTWKQQSAPDLENHVDGGKFRDFAVAAHLEHPDVQVLEWTAEELVDVFGWRVDLTFVD